MNKYITLSRTNLVIAAIITLYIFTIMNHEFWRDEGQHIFLATEVSWQDLVNITRYEGIFPFYHAFLKIAFDFTNSYKWALRSYNLLFYSLFVLAISTSNIKNIYKLAALISYPFFYEYGVISRQYAVIPLSLVLIVLDSKFKFWESYLKYIGAMLLAFVGPLGVLIGGTYLAFRIFKKRPQGYELLLYGVALFLFGLVAFSAMPIPGRDWNPLVIPNSHSIIKSAVGIFSSLFYFPIVKYNNFLYFVSLVLGLGAAAWVFMVLYKTSRREFTFLMCITIFNVGFFSISTHHTWRHYFPVAMLFFLYGLREISSDKVTDGKSRIYNFLEKIFKISILFSAAGGVLSASFDILYEYSASNRISKIIESRKINVEDIAVFQSWAASSWLVYNETNDKPYQIMSNQRSGFNHLNGYKPEYLTEELTTYMENPLSQYLIIGCQYNDCIEEYQWGSKYAGWKWEFINSPSCVPYESYLFGTKN